MEIDKKLYSDIKDYCKANNLKIGEFINELLQKAFMIEKYGDKPPIFKENLKKVIEEDKEFETTPKKPISISVNDNEKEFEEKIVKEIKDNINTSNKKSKKRTLN